MSVKDVFRKYGAIFVALVVFLIAGYVYCFPVLQGKVLSGGDFEKSTGAMNEVVEYAVANGNNSSSWWTGSMFCGMPNYQIGGSMLESEKFLGNIFSLFNNAGWPLILFFYFISFYTLMRSFGVGRWLSIGGAFAVGLSSYFIVIIPAGHFTKVLTIPMCAFVFAGFKFIFSKKYLLGASLSMLFVALSVSLHPQMFYYYFMLIGVVWISELAVHIKEKRIKDLIVATLIFVSSVGLGIGCRSAQMFANAEYIPETIRGGRSEIVSEETPSETASDVDTLRTGPLTDLEYATLWSYGIDETMTLMIPGFKGVSSCYNVGDDSDFYDVLMSHGSSREDASITCDAVQMYWGDQPSTLGNVYVGAVVCLLFLLGLLIVEGPLKWSLFAATLFSIALAWGRHFMWLTELFYNYFPMYGKFRSVSSILIVAEIAMPLLGFLALKEIIEGNVPKKKVMKSLAISFGVTAGICLFFAFFGNSIYSFRGLADDYLDTVFPKWYMAEIVAERAKIFRMDCIRSFLFIAAAALFILLYQKGKLHKSLFVALFCALVVLDMWPVDRRIFNNDNFSTKQSSVASFVKLPYEVELLKDKDPHFRVLNLTVDTYNDSRTSFYFKSLGGYSAVKLRRYQDIIDRHLKNLNLKVIAMLNAKYIIWKDDDGNAVPMRNPDAMGNAWWVDSIVCVNNANDESDALNTLDLRRVAVMDESFKGMVKDLNPGWSARRSVELTSYSPKTLTYLTHSSKDGIVVFSEIYYPHGWKATIDGKETDIFRVNYVLRAMNVPKGDHCIIMTFEPDSVRKGNIFSIICIFLMYGFIAGSIVWFVIRKIREYIGNRKLTA